MNGEAYDRESQNNSRLSELSAKVTALRGVTVDIYDNARAQDVIDNTVCVHPLFKVRKCRLKPRGEERGALIYRGVR